MKRLLISALALTALAVQTQPGWSDDDPIAQEETQAKDIKDRPEWNDNLKSTYNLTDEQIAALKAKGMNYPQIAIASQLAMKSGKPVDDVVKMRMESTRSGTERNRPFHQRDAP